MQGQGQAHRQKYSMHCPMPSLASQTEWVLCVVKLSHVELFTQSAHSAGPWSIKHKGNCWDNAVAENLFATLKKGKIRGETFATREQARSVVFQYIVLLQSSSQSFI